MATLNPAVYCGTYAKYNDGSIVGAWLNLNDYDDADAFYAACVALHNDENDPELMLQDNECIPDQCVSESSVSPEFCDYLNTIKESHLNQEVFEASAELDIPLDMVEELYQGQHDSDESFACQMAEDMGSIPDEHHWPTSYIDWVMAARDLMVDYAEHDRHYFRTSY